MPLKFFLFLILFLSIFFTSCQSPTPSKPKAVKGFLDLSHWNFEQQGTVELRGEWEFYWQKIIRSSDTTTKSVYQVVPQRWNGAQIGNTILPREGYATYRLKIRLALPYQNVRMAFKMGYVNSAYKIFLQKDSIGGVGKFGITEADYTPNLNPQFYSFIPNRDSLDLIIHVANFQDRQSGLTGNVILGLERQIIDLHEYKNNYIFFVMGILLIMGVYHLSLYFFRNKIITDLFKDSPFQLSSKLSYLSFSLGVWFSANFFYAVYPKDFFIKVRDAVKWVALAYAVVILFTKLSFYSQLLVGFQLFTLCFIVYTLFFTVLIVLRRREGSLTFMGGVLCILAAAINDIMMANQMIETFIAIPLGLLAFIFSQTLLLSSLFSKAFQKVEDLSEKLIQLNNNLENTVKERTEELGNTNNELAITNEKLNQVLEETRQTLEIVNEQRVKLAETHREITSSLNYAQRIQQTLLSHITVIKKTFPESFILFRPRDIVSGDFYWFADIPNKSKIVLAAIDCTGHGVPGAFMTMISHQLLDEIVIGKGITEPNEILNYLHRAIRRVLRQEQTSSREGMDLALVVIDTENRTMEFSGAKNPIVYIQNGILHHIKGDRISIGGEQMEQNRTFTKHKIDLSVPTTFYLFSDGYQDQFGGKQKRKFMLKQMKEIFSQIYHQPIDFQKDYLERTLSEWMEAGLESQTDDILLIGVKV